MTAKILRFECNRNYSIVSNSSMNIHELILKGKLMKGGRKIKPVIDVCILSLSEQLPISLRQNKDEYSFYVLVHLVKLAFEMKCTME